MALKIWREPGYFQNLF